MTSDPISIYDYKNRIECPTCKGSKYIRHEGEYIRQWSLVENPYHRALFEGQTMRFFHAMRGTRRIAKTRIWTKDFHCAQCGHPCPADVEEVIANNGMCYKDPEVSDSSARWARKLCEICVTRNAVIPRNRSVWSRSLRQTNA